MMEFIKKIGSNLLEISDIMKTSLPVKIFEAKSYLERIVEGFSFAPIFLTQAAQTTDPVERLKLVICFAISGLALTCRQAKPFNPILGETYEATFADGTQVFCEQTSHHPPVTAWEFIGPNGSYHFHGRGAWVASFRMNSVTGQQQGESTVEFTDGTRIVFGPLPEVSLRGILFSDRVMEYFGKMRFSYPDHNLSCEISFNPDRGMLKWLRGASTPTDVIRGEIVKDAGTTQKVCQVEGTWLGGLDFDDVRYWDIMKIGPAQKTDATPLPDGQALPSDSRYREDLRFLRENDLDKSSEWKTKLEEKQRYDAKLRKEGDKKYGHVRHR